MLYLTNQKITFNNLESNRMNRRMTKEEIAQHDVYLNRLVWQGMIDSVKAMDKIENSSKVVMRPDLPENPNYKYDGAKLTFAPRKLNPIYFKKVIE